MPNLHVYYLNGNVKAFRQELDGSSGKNTSQAGHAGGGSLGKSWGAGGYMSNGKADPNERDAFGRT
jgi:hypothetical protein